MNRLHLISLPHTRVEPGFCCCAYTSKVLKFCKMMGQNYEIILYAPEGDDVPGATLKPCLSDLRRQQIFDVDDPHRLALWPSIRQTAEFNARVIAALYDNLAPRDLILLTGGATHQPIVHAFPNHLFCEPFCGYEGICTDKVAFESYSHQNRVYALKGLGDGRWFDSVIPNFFDQSEFLEAAVPKDYLLYLGRVIARKGVAVAGEIAKVAGMELIIAGPGAQQVGKDVVAPEVTIPNATYVGTVDIQERAKLLAGAVALLAPTTYLEPFGGVAVEAMMSGCPAITTDWGAFPETVPVIAGARFRTLKEGVAAVSAVQKLDRSQVQAYARSNYSLDAVKPRFIRWFNQVDSLWAKGWYELSDMTG